MLGLLTAAGPGHPCFHVVAPSLPGYAWSDGVSKGGFRSRDYAEVGPLPEQPDRFSYLHNLEAAEQADDINTVTNDTTHPLANHNTIVLRITNDGETELQIISLYHEVDLTTRKHRLHHLLQFETDERTPTLLIGDFNTHAPRWSLPGRTPSTWATDLTNWLDENGFDLRNPPDVPTWESTRPQDRPSIIDLAFANEAATLSNQIGEVTVSFADSLGSDHASLSLNFYPLHSLAILPPPAPNGFRTDDEHREAWSHAFLQQLTNSHSDALAGAETTAVYYLTPRAEANAYGANGPVVSSPLVAAPHRDEGQDTVRLQHAVVTFESAIEEASRLTLPPK